MHRVDVWFEHTGPILQSKAWLDVDLGSIQTHFIHLILNSVMLKQPYVKLSCEELAHTVHMATHLSQTDANHDNARPFTRLDPKVQYFSPNEQ